MELGISRMGWDWKSVEWDGIRNHGMGWDWESVICESLILDPIHPSDWESPKWDEIGNRMELEIRRMGLGIRGMEL